MTEFVEVCPECDEAAVTVTADGYRCKKCSAHFQETVTRRSFGHGQPTSAHAKAAWEADADDVFGDLEVGQ